MSNLNDLIKSPVVYLFNSSGTLLTNIFGKMGLGVVEFTYEYDDEEEDKCTIKIQATNCEVLDTLNISRNDILKVQWGYLTGPLGPLATVGVRDILSKDGPNIIYTELKCTDLTNHLKNMRPADVRTMSLIDYISDYVSRSANVVIRSGTDIIYKQPLNNPNKGGFKFYEDQSGVNPAVYNPFFIKPMQGWKATLSSVSSSTESIKGTWFTDANNKVKAYFERDIDMISVNRSPYNVITEYLSACPLGPWFVTGRADTLLIHNRNLGNPIYKNYAYAQENGELIDFTAETKYESFEKQAVVATDLDPRTKNLKGYESFINRLAIQRNFKEIVEDTLITEEERDRQLKEFIILSHDPYLVQIQRFESFTEAEYWVNNNISDFLPKQEDQLLDMKKAFSKMFLVPEGQINKSPWQHHLGSVVVFSIPVDNPGDLANEQTNTLRKLEMETEEANIILEGDPNLMSEQVIGIHKVQKVHIGNYYIKKCQHTISEMGYKTTIEALKVKNNAIIKNYTTDSGVEKSVEDEISLKLPILYSRQEELFKKWNVVVKFQVLSVSGNVTVPGTSIDLYVSKTLDDILERNDINDDDKLIKIKSYLKNPLYEIKYNERIGYSYKDR